MGICVLAGGREDGGGGRMKWEKEDRRRIMWVSRLTCSGDSLV